MARRRLIKQWTDEYCARNGYTCTACDTTITAFSFYMRYVYVNVKNNRLEVERVHVRPDCANFYYMGN